MHMEINPFTDIDVRCLECSKTYDPRLATLMGYKKARIFCSEKCEEEWRKHFS